ncbi:MAG TPA: MBL fold metallo-hydrolase [Polyangia bacterium]|jgi:L-ascorbate metabolism protein UlaG (beta-lactamase superfamily)|nr:MBL fold metallo-hydrolase [Polyangia bacterium]
MALKFKNLEPPYEPQPYGQVFKWAVSDRFWSRRREAPRRVLIPKKDPDLGLIASAAPSLTWVGHATWLVRLGGLSIVTDPVWSDAIGPRIERNMPPGLELEKAAPDLVLVTHNHRDHLDEPTIRRIGPKATYVVPHGLGAFFRRRGLDKVHELEWWQEETVGGVKVTFVPSQHWSQRTPFDRNDTLWGGFVIEAEGRRVYHSGDTAYFSGFGEIGRRFPGIDAALLPIGAYDPEWFMRQQHMTPEDAMRAFLDLGARLFCAMHWGTFKLTDEPLDEPPVLLEQARDAAKLERERVWIAAIGETRAL